MGEKKTTTGTCGLLEGRSPNKYQKKRKKGKHEKYGEMSRVRLLPSHRRHTHALKCPAHLRLHLPHLPHLHLL